MRVAVGPGRLLRVFGWKGAKAHTATLRYVQGRVLDGGPLQEWVFEVTGVHR